MAALNVLVIMDSSVMVSPMVISMNALLMTIHAIKMLSVLTLSVLINVLVLTGKMVMETSAMTSTNVLRILTTVMSVLEFVVITMILLHVHVKLEQAVMV